MTTSALRFSEPVQGQGLGEAEVGPQWSHVYQLVAAANGYALHGRQWNLTSFEHDTEYLQVSRNRGSGGRHQEWQKSTDGSVIGQMTDSGLSVTSLAASGAATVGGTLGVSGAATFDATLDVAGAATFDDTLGVTGAATFGATISVTGAATFDDTLAVAGTATFDADADVAGDLTVGGTLDVAGAATFDATLGVTGAATFNGAVTLGNAAADAITITGTPTVTPPATFAGEPLVTGDALHTTGAGVGTIYDSGSGIGSIYAYDYGAAAYKRLDIDASDLRLGFAGTARIRINTTGLGLFNVTPIARPTVAGVATGTLGQLQTAFQNLCSALDSLGAIIDGTS